jgi:hypothetical protein
VSTSTEAFLFAGCPHCMSFHWSQSYGNFSNIHMKIKLLVFMYREWLAPCTHCFLNSVQTRNGCKMNWSILDPAITLRVQHLPQMLPGHYLVRWSHAGFTCSVTDLTVTHVTMWHKLILDPTWCIGVRFYYMYSILHVNHLSTRGLPTPL